MTSSLRTGPRLGLICWAVQPLYLAVELIAAAVSRAPYSLLHNTISDLGATTCTTVSYPSQEVPVCSPANVAVNASFVLFGLSMAAGAVLLRSRFPRGGLSTAAIATWVTAGLSSVGSGLIPLDQRLELHALVSAPGIVLSGAAVILMGVTLARSWSRAWWIATAVGALSAAAGLLLIRLEVQWGGLIERVALWPSFAACLAVAMAIHRRVATAGA